MPNGIVLGEEHTALMFISTKCSTIDQLDRIKDEIIRKELGESLQFVGKCFGKFDVIAEFREDSAKLASYKACIVQEKASGMIERDYQLQDPFCSSLVLCNEFLEINGKKRSTRDDLPIRFYSIFIPKISDFNLSKALKEVKDNMRLLFSSSYFTFLLIISGDTFYDVFNDFKTFRENTKNSFAESSTYVTINWNSNIKDNPSGDRKIQANVFLRLKKGFGDLEEIGCDDVIKCKYKRFGSFDLSLLLETETLSQMKEKIFELRDNDKISHTSTALLMEVENERNGD